MPPHPTPRNEYIYMTAQLEMMSYGMKKENRNLEGGGGAVETTKRDRKGC